MGLFIKFESEEDVVQKLIDHNQLLNRGVRLHSEIDSYMDEMDKARYTYPDLNSRFQNAESEIQTNTQNISQNTSNVSMLLQSGIKPQVPNQAALPMTGNSNGDLRFSIADLCYFEWSSTLGKWQQSAGATGGTGTTTIDPSTAQRLLDAEINILKNSFKIQTMMNSSKYGQKNMVVDDYSDLSGINVQKSFGYVYDALNKQIKNGQTSMTFQDSADWNTLSLSQMKALNNALELNNPGLSNYKITYGNLVTATSNGSIATGQFNINAVTDSSNNVHVVVASNRLNATYTNIDLYTIQANGNVIGPIAITSFTTANTTSPWIAVGPHGTRHIVFQSEAGASTSYWNLGYVTVDVNGVVSGVTWLTSSTTQNSEWPHIHIDPNGVKWVIYYSIPLGNAFAYMTIDANGNVGTPVKIVGAASNQGYATGMDAQGNIKMMYYVGTTTYGYTLSNSGTIAPTTPATVGWSGGASQYGMMDSSGTLHWFSNNSTGFTHLMVTSTGNFITSNPYLFLVGAALVSATYDPATQRFYAALSYNVNGVQNLVGQTVDNVSGGLSSQYVMTNSSVALSEHVTVMQNGKPTTIAVSNGNLVYVQGTPNNGPILQTQVNSNQSGATANSITFADGVMDQNGTLHVVTQAVNNGQVGLITVDSHGIPSSAVIVAYTSGYYSFTPQIALDKNGTRYIVFASGAQNSTNSYFAIGFVTVDANNNIGPVTWLTAAATTAATSCTSPSIWVDGNLTAHVAWVMNKQIWYTTISSSGVVSTPIQLTNTGTNDLPCVVCDGNNNTYINFQSSIYNSNLSNMAMITISPSGQISPIAWLTTYTGNGQDSTNAYNYVDANNTVHVAFTSKAYYSGFANVAYVSVSNNGTISPVTWITLESTTTLLASGGYTGYYYPSVQADSAGTKHFSYAGYYGLNNADTIMFYSCMDANGFVSSSQALYDWAPGSGASNTHSYGNYAGLVGWAYGGAFIYAYCYGTAMYTNLVPLQTFSSSGSATRTFDAGQSVTWTSIDFLVAIAQGTAFTIQASVSNDNQTWTNAVTVSNAAPLNLIGRYLKLTISASTTNSYLSPILTNLQINYTNSNATIVSTADVTNIAPTKFVLDAQYSLGTSGSIAFYVSRDGGVTWLSVQPDSLTDISSLPNGTSVVSKVVLTNDSSIKALGYSWS